MPPKQDRRKMQTNFYIKFAATEISFAAFWWSTGLQIRTESRRNVRQRHCLGSVFAIVGENQPVVKYIYAVEKNIDDLPLVFLVAWVAIFEPADPFDNVFPAVFWPFQFCL